MSKTFYTQHDIQDLHQQGVTRLYVNSDDIVLTELARDEAYKLGLILVYEDDAPQPAANTTSSSAPTNLAERVRGMIRARLGEQADPLVVEKAVARVLSRLGV